MEIALAVSICFNVYLVFVCLVRKNSVMAILAYIEFNKLPKPTEAEMKMLCTEAWRHMFRRG